jgi:hypothetical protein
MLILHHKEAVLTTFCSDDWLTTAAIVSSTRLRFNTIEGLLSLYVQ